jgi:RNA polymerase sigma-70 factor (ECF subfamily)
VRTGGRLDFGDVYDRHFEAVYAYVAYRVAPDGEAARDITQDVFLAALKALPQFRGDGCVLTWLRSIARNKVADHFRTRVPAIDCRADEAALEATPAMSEGQERALMVSGIMRRLPREYAELLEEKYLDDVAVKEIARRRHTSEKAVESALTRARRAFRKAAEEYHLRGEVTK